MPDMPDMPGGGQPQTGESKPTKARRKACGACGRPWFGMVAFCPYCGRETSQITEEPATAQPAPSAPITYAVPEPATAQAPQPLPQDDRQQAAAAAAAPGAAPRRKPFMTPLVKGVLAGVVAVVVVWTGILLMPIGAGKQPSAKLAPPPAAAPAPVPAAPREVARAPTRPLQPVPQPEAVTAATPINAPAPHPNRSLCSEKDEAANLCKLQ